ncbi:MAG: M23 family metallopeptidase [Spirochaetota bacterium]|nr:M23 family metallopeptidase [Spirochaetota bacterium]
MKFFPNRFLLYSTIFITILISVYATSDDLIKWPVDLPKSLSGTLCEIRGLSLHQGIDIKTRSRVGFPVYAASSGKVIKLISKETGYGNAIFLEHEDNLTSVYGHLDSFEDFNHKLYTLSETLKILYNNEKIYFRFFTGNISYRKGDIIGYTGESGSGYPHLHFELREDGIFSNPMKYIDIKDDQSPVIERIFVCIENYNSTIKKKQIRIKQSWGRYYPVENPVEITGTGRLFLKISCYDRANAQNRVAIYKIKMFNNNNEIFNITFDLINRIDFKYSHLIYDISRSSIDGHVSYTYFLCQRKGNRYRGLKCSNKGYIESWNGENDIRIEVYDYAGNKSSAELKIIKKNIEEKFIPNFLYVSKGKRSIIRSRTDSFSIIFDRGSIYRDTLINVTDNFPKQLINSIAKSILIDPKDIIKIYQVSPSDIIHRKPVKILIKKPEEVSKIEVENILIYQFFKGKKPKPLKTEYNSKEENFTAVTRVNGYFALIKDTIPPGIYLPPTHEFYEDKEFYRKIRFSTYDNLSMIDKDSIECIVDGETFPFRFDNDRKWIEMSLPKRSITRGEHHILIKISDMASNQSVFRDLIIF